MKIAAILTVLALAGVPVQAQTRESVWHKLGHHKALIAGYAAVAAAALGDWRSTMQCIQLPGGVCSEANPILLAAGIDPAAAHGSRQLLGFKLALTVGAFAGGELARREGWLSERRVSQLLWSVAVTQAGVDIHNRLLTEQLIRRACPSAAVAGC